jgi:hypothetical protein
MKILTKRPTPSEIETALDLHAGDVVFFRQYYSNYHIEFKDTVTLTRKQIKKLDSLIKNGIIGIPDITELSKYNTAEGEIATYLQTGKTALTNWATLNNAQKDAVLKNLLKYLLWQEGVL